MPATTADIATRDLHHQTDADLLRAATKRDQQAFALLVDRYYQLVYRVVWRMTNGHADSEDIAQEAFLRLWNNPSQVREAAALKGWLMRVANNLVMDRFRSKAMVSIDDTMDFADNRPGADETMTQSWASKRMNQAVAALPDRQKLALSLVHFEQMSNIAAAHAMEITVDALESLLSRARRALKHDLAADRETLLAAVPNQGN